ncbi:MAG: 2-amino-4-hydroxy-6-hydroxymethyldihydropteridine diphosphokinase [Rhizobiales bacterium]|nr:2-amino-4-hydroxy-6-hydroxymethyldihydropteridine diphosphokinase [Hyphomicrobiales bacterium]
MVPVGFALGSNMGDKVAIIRRALDELAATSDLKIDRVSSFYRTPPWGVENQDWFVNVCAVGRASLQPEDLLAQTQAVEKALGRQKTIRWGPRVIDIDILFYGDADIDMPNLTIPHKSIAERAFVLVPLQEILPDFQLNGVSLSVHIDRLKDKAAGVTIIRQNT